MKHCGGVDDGGEVEVVIEVGNEVENDDQRGQGVDGRRWALALALASDPLWLGLRTVFGGCGDQLTAVVKPGLGNCHTRLGSGRLC